MSIWQSTGRVSALLAIGIVASLGAVPQTAPNRYALILEDPPVSDRFVSRTELDSVGARSYRQQIEARQQLLRKELASRNFQVTGTVSTVLNAIFVMSPKERLAELRSLPGVKGVVPQRRYKVNLNRATQLLNAPAAWTALGGMQNAGAGMKIGILDTGIEQTSAVFQDSALKPPAGYPICNVSNCAAYTNNKVIVARSYVSILAAGTDPNNPAADSRPDDYSPRDRVGHGTATASCAAGESTVTPAGLTISGMAPKAFLGNYKIFGSPNVNDGASDDGIIQALEDALNDHMDVASLSIGAPAFTGPLDTGAACGNPTGVACDLVPPVIEKLFQAGLVVVVAAGNDGDGFESVNAPVFNTIETPGDSPSAIAVGATTNSHFMSEGVEVPGSGIPSNLQLITGVLGDGPIPGGAVQSPLRDVTQLGDSGLGCAALPAGSLNGAFALIERGSCTFLTKVLNAQNAGATGVIFYMADQTSLIGPGNLSSTNIPSINISNNDGVALKSFIDANPLHNVIIDTSAFEQSKPSFNQLAFFSSTGPSVGDNALKPELVAVGGSDGFFTDMYMAGQSLDPLGFFYTSNGFVSGSGTSFATPLVAGAAALVKQAHPSFTAADIKSALVNTTSQAVTSDETGDNVGVQSIGSGLLDAAAALKTTVTAIPATISFGLANTVPITKSFQVNNRGSASVNLTLAVAPASSSSKASVTVDKTSLTLAAGASSTVNVSLTGSAPSAGSYSGAVTITGGVVPLRVPYLFLVGDGASANLTALAGDGNDGTAGQVVPDGVLAIKLIDQYGVPISGAKVSVVASRGASVQNADAQTNAYGIATAEATLGSLAGSYDFTMNAGGLSWDFIDFARLVPAISPNGIVNAASFESGKPVAPGSYVSIFGNNLSDTTNSETSLVLPLTIDFATVSFDVPSAKISVPGRMIFVSPGQVNVQVPWELQGQTSAQVKDTIDFTYGNVVTLALSDYAPAFFEIGGGNVAALDLSNKVIGASNPAQQGVAIQLYANALGPVNNQPATGDPAPLAPLANCKGTAVVMVGGKTASTSFCGLAPGFPALYQLNTVVPTGLTPGANSITVSIGGQTSKASSIMVK